jgi:lysophospholipase L1-like esterase
MSEMIRAIPALKEILAKPESPSQGIKLITVWFGTNDAMLPESPQSVPIGEYKQNIRSIIELLSKRVPNTKIVMLTPGPTGNTVDPLRHPDRPLIYATACEAVANEFGVLVLNVYDVMVKEAGGATPGKLAPFL